GLGSFVERELKNAYKDKAASQALRYVGDDKLLAKKTLTEWDVAALLRLMWEAWNDVFRNTLGQAERTLVSELRDVRNKWAHQQPFSSDDTDRALDSAERLLTAVSAPQADGYLKIEAEIRPTGVNDQEGHGRHDDVVSAIRLVAQKPRQPTRTVA